jgi:hypothetical protein
MVPLLSASCALAALVMLASVPASSQTAAKKAKYKAPRTPWVDPDLQGVWPATDMINTPLQRPHSRIAATLAHGDLRSYKQRSRNRCSIFAFALPNWWISTSGARAQACGHAGTRRQSERNRWRRSRGSGCY